MQIGYFSPFNQLDQLSALFFRTELDVSNIPMKTVKKGKYGTYNKHEQPNKKSKITVNAAFGKIIS